MKFLLLLLLVSANAYSQSNEELARRLDILSEEIQNIKAYQLQMGDTSKQAYNLGPSASKVYFIPKGISIGAYGEIVYTNQASENQDGDPVDSDPTAEAYRLVTYIGYKFNDKWIVNTEIEIEHVDEVFNEFMYIDHLASESLNYRFGLILLPVGFINEQHEPILFPSVNRPDVAGKIIPTTWRELGLGIFGTSEKLSYKAFLVNGGDADSIAANKGFRGTRKKGGAGGKDNASTGAAVVRLDYNQDKNNLYGFSIYTGQASSSSTENLNTTLVEAHSQLSFSNWRLRLLYSQVAYSNADDWAEAGNAALPDLLQGGYVEALYRISSGAEVYEPFIRYERLNLNAEYNEDNYTYDPSIDYNTIRVGVAYKPLSQVTFKADYGFIDKADDQGVNEFNLGMGFNF